jgi:hypothetical protein
MSAKKLLAIAPMLPLRDFREAQEPAPVLRFDFSGRRPDDRLGKGPVSAQERSTLKAAILTWLDEQL